MPRQRQAIRRTKGKVPEFFPTLDLLTLINGCEDAADHHCADADGHDTTKAGAVDRNDLAHILAVNVQGGPDGLRLTGAFAHQFRRHHVEKTTELTFTV